MQGVILTVGGDRNLILGDDGSRYGFEASEWRGSGSEPVAGTRVDFEAHGSGAIDIIPIPTASTAPSAQTSTATSASAQTQPNGSTGAEKTAQMFSRLNEGLNTRYQPIREAIGDNGVIGVGIAVLVIGSLFLVDAFEDLRDAIGSVAILAGLAIIVLALIMLGKERGWWKTGEAAGAEGGVPAGSQAGASNPQTQPAPPEQPMPIAPAQEATPPSANATKTCHHCNAEILAAAILCRFCRSDVSSQT